MQVQRGISRGGFPVPLFVFPSVLIFCLEFRFARTLETVVCDTLILASGIPASVTQTRRDIPRVCSNTSCRYKH